MHTASLMKRNQSQFINGADGVISHSCDKMGEHVNE